MVGQIYYIGQEKNRSSEYDPQNGPGGTLCVKTKGRVLMAEVATILRGVYTILSRVGVREIDELCQGIGEDTRTVETKLEFND